MTNEGLKKKIKHVINAADISIVLRRDDIIILADALIAAGVVDKSDYASMKETAVKYKAEVSKAENRAKEAEHRAARAERALKEFAAYTGCTSCPYEQRCPDAPIPDNENNYKKCFDNYLAFAEKDLMEE